MDADEPGHLLCSDAQFLNSMPYNTSQAANMGYDSTPYGLTAKDVLQRYTRENLPAFSGIELTDVNQVGVFGETPLDVAIARGNLRELDALLKGGANVNAPGDSLYTALHVAASVGNPETVKILLEYGADPGLRNELGQTALDIARAGGREDLVALLNGS